MKSNTSKKYVVGAYFADRASAITAGNARTRGTEQQHAAFHDGAGWLVKNVVVDEVYDAIGPIGSVPYGGVSVADLNVVEQYDVVRDLTSRLADPNDILLVAAEFGAILGATRFAFQGSPPDTMWSEVLRLLSYHPQITVEQIYRALPNR